MNVKNYLNQCYRLNEIIDSNKNELVNLNNLAISIQSMKFDSDKIKKSNTSNDAKFVEIILKIEELERKIYDDIDKYVSLEDEIRNVIDSVKNNTERTIFRYRYLNFFTWEKIAGKTNLSVRQVHRIHKIALKNLQMSLNVT